MKMRKTSTGKPPYLELLALLEWASQKGYTRACEAKAALVAARKVLNPTKRGEYRKGKIISATAVALGNYSRQSIYRLLKNHGPEVLALRLRAKGRPDLAVHFSSDAGAE